MALNLGVHVSEQATAVSTPVKADVSVPFVVGAAPAHAAATSLGEPLYRFNESISLVTVEGCDALPHGTPGNCRKRILLQGWLSEVPLDSLKVAKGCYIIIFFVVQPFFF